MIEERVKKILSSVMNVPVEEISRDSSPDTIETWDSLKQMTLIMTLEQEFNIEFSEEKVYELLSCDRIIQALEEAEQHAEQS